MFIAGRSGRDQTSWIEPPPHHRPRAHEQGLEFTIDLGTLAVRDRHLAQEGNRAGVAAAAEALLLAHRGELEQAEALANLAVTTAETTTDNVWWHAWTHEDLATVLERAGRIDEARESLGRSLAQWERKGCLPCAARVRDQIGALGPVQA